MMAEYSVMEGEARSLKLMFSGGIASDVVTGKSIAGGDEMKVVLVENETNEAVVSGPEASVRAKIVLLPEDFGGVWTSSEFKDSVITNWKNKKNILQGDAYVDLKHGSGTVGKIWIKHDKTHLAKTKFRLGAMVVDCPYDYPIKEALTDSFQVQDRRNELNRKTELVSLNDKVSRLKNIGKKIRKRLANENIMTVKDFLRNLSSNPSALQKIYGGKGKKWNETVGHAKTSIDKGCDIEGNLSLNDQIGYVEPYEPSPLSHGEITEEEWVDELFHNSDLEPLIQAYPEDLYMGLM